MNKSEPGYWAYASLHLDDFNNELKSLTDKKSVTSGFERAKEKLAEAFRNGFQGNNHLDSVLKIYTREVGQHLSSLSDNVTKSDAEKKLKIFEADMRGLLVPENDPSEVLKKTNEELKRVTELDKASEREKKNKAQKRTSQWLLVSYGFICSFGVVFAIGIVRSLSFSPLDAPHIRTPQTEQPEHLRSLIRLQRLVSEEELDPGLNTPFKRYIQDELRDRRDLLLALLARYPVKEPPSFLYEVAREQNVRRSELIGKREGIELSGTGDNGYPWLQ